MYFNNPSLEAIDFQTNSKLGMDLEVAFTTLRGLSGVTQRTLDRSNLSKVIKKNTGLDMDVELAAEGNYHIDDELATVIMDVDKNNAVLSEWRQSWTEGFDGITAIDKATMGTTGTIDLVNVKVTGIFCEFNSTLYLSRNLLGKDSILTIRELVGIVLHEIGHAFSYLEALGRGARTNFVLSNAAKELMGTSDKKRKYEILDEIEEASKIKISDRDLVLQSRDEVGITTVLLSDMMVGMRSELGCNIYDYRGFEQLADQFAARMGYGADVVTALDKLFRKYGDAAYRGRITFMLIEVGKGVSFIGAMVAAVLISSVSPAHSIFIVMMGALILSNNPLLDIYDKPKRRFEVIKNELNKALKNKSISKAEKLKYISDIDYIDNVLSDMNSRESLYAWVWKTVMPWGRKQARSMDMQKALEDLANSKLYTSSAKLETLV